MDHPTRDDIVAYRFTRNRKAGYDTLEVDAYLNKLADDVGRMQAELEQFHATDRAALEVLRQAKRVAHETAAAAERDARLLRRSAKEELEKARSEARVMLDTARAEADRTLLTAQEQADAAVERSQARVAELEAAGRERTNEYERIVDSLREQAADAAERLRSSGLRLEQMAERYSVELPHSATGAAPPESPQEPHSSTS